MRPPGLAAGASLEAWLSPDTAGRQMVFVDGVFDAALSDLSALPDAVYAGSLGELPGQLSAQAHAKLAPLPETVSDKRTELGSHALAALNHASLADVAVVHVGAAAAAARRCRFSSCRRGRGWIARATTARSSRRRRSWR